VYDDFADVRGKGVGIDNAVPTTKTRFTDILVYGKERYEASWQSVAGTNLTF